MRRVLLLLALLAPLGGQQSSVGDSAGNPAKVLHDLFREQWDYEAREEPVSASYRGDRRYNDRWPDRSLAAVARANERDRQLLTRLASIDRSKLSPADQLNYDLFQRQVRERIEEHAFRWFLVPVSHLSGIQSANEVADALPFTQPKDYQDWLARLRAFPAYMDQTIALMREGIRERRLQPKVVMRRVAGQVERQLVSDPTESPFYRPFREVTAGVPTAERIGLQRDAREAVQQAVIPAFRRFQEFLAKEYLPAAFDPVGVWQVPDGENLYAALARQSTTTTLTPQQIHALGLAEVKRIRGEMEAIQAKVGFRGGLKEFFQHLRTDPRFFHSTQDELLNAYRAMSKEIDPHLVRLFRTLPRTPYGVQPIPAATAPDQTTAYYLQPALDGSRAGTYFVNLYRPEVRPKWEMMALSLHEAVPGHHLQIARAQELGEVPLFRRNAGFTAFVEGWGLYAESLGDEMGLYGDPYSKFGQLTYEMWRAVRLVVDTGMHQMRWTRQQAIDYFLDNAAKTELDVTNEIDRYISWPGQALAYKVGELKIKELRARATRELGTAFDVREFHDVVLGLGAVPLDVLEATVDRWIAQRKAGRTG